MIIKKVLFIFLFFSLLNTKTFAEKVLITIGKSGQMTEQQLEASHANSPFCHTISSN